MPIKIFDKLATIVSVTGWVCDQCKVSARSTQHHLPSDFAHLAEDIAALKCEITDLQAANHRHESNITESMTVNETSTEVAALRQLVSTQQHTIGEMQTHLKFVLSYLGIDETNAARINNRDNQNTAAESIADAIDNLDGGRHASDHEQWSEVVSKRQRKGRADTIQQSIVTAVYVLTRLLKRDGKTAL